MPKINPKTSAAQLKELQIKELQRKHKALRFKNAVLERRHGELLAERLKADEQRELQRRFAVVNHLKFRLFKAQYGLATQRDEKLIAMLKKSIEDAESTFPGSVAISLAHLLIKGPIDEAEATRRLINRYHEQATNNAAWLQEPVARYVARNLRVVMTTGMFQEYA